jgi:DNA polymerase III epsilon subunit-like protein
MKLFYDTETTGFIPKHCYGNNTGSLPVITTSNGMPYIVAIACILTDDDLNEVMSFNAVLKPDKYTIPEDATAVHGITTEFAIKWGLERASVLSTFAKIMAKADECIAHNNIYDLAVLQGEYKRFVSSSSIIETLFKKKHFCTMVESRDICKMKHAKGAFRNGYKNPKLSEAHEILCGFKMGNAHNAMNDTKACLNVYKMIKEFHNGD